MKVAYRIVGQVGYTTLFDEESGVGALATFCPAFSDQNYYCPGFGAGSQGITPEGNTVCTLSLTFNLKYAALGNVDAYQQAVASVRLFRALKGRSLHIQVVQGGEVQYYPNGGVETYAPNVTGASVDHAFVFKTQDVQTAAP